MNQPLKSPSRSKSPRKNKEEPEKKIMFNYRALRPEENSEMEFQFEEIRARRYYAKYKLEDEIKNKYVDEIMDLKRK